MTNYWLVLIGATIWIFGLGFFIARLDAVAVFLSAWGGFLAGWGAGRAALTEEADNKY